MGFLLLEGENMFIDEAKISVRAGKGGDGATSFRHEKYVPDGGPDGGDGGNGGNIILRVDDGMKTLMDFRYKTKYSAENGENGGKKKMFGKNGRHLTLSVPPGTVVKDAETNLIIADLVEKGQSVIIAKGGKGGKGNTRYKSSIRQAPNFSEAGDPGDERILVLELKLLAEVGLIGLPNVGKSTILSKVSKAKPKIANYHFTTIHPNLGVVEAVKGKSFAMADIPGLIEGAHEGTGLGHDFLRHIERTRLLVHVVDISGSEGRNPVNDFEMINEELRSYSDDLAAKKQIVVGNKTDLTEDPSDIDSFREEMENRGYEVFFISAAASEGLDDLMKKITGMLDNLQAVETGNGQQDKEEHKIYRYKKRERDWEIEKINETFHITGYSVEKLMKSTNFEDWDSVQRFQGILKKKGVFEELKKMGAVDGSTIEIEGYEFDYIE